MAASIVMPGKAGARELLFVPDHLWDRTSKELPGGWMYCFPNCGRLERQGKSNLYYYDGHVYELPLHGFAWTKAWTVVEVKHNSLLLRLRDDQQTRLAYPFHFTLEYLYEITDRTLFCRQTYINHGDRPMPYNAGFHPYFSTPEPGGAKNHVILNFTPRRRLRYNQQLTDIVGELPLFPVPVSVGNPEINEQLFQIGEDKHIYLTYPNGDVINMAVEGVEDRDMFPYLQLYSPPDQPFVCVEPWMGYPNALNSVAGVRWLAPGQKEHGALRLWLE
ncbi:MAG: aldose epimerase [Proteobacteria bacterium]|nr:aldose epimerase [Pseudomonadota bacterium]